MLGYKFYQTFSKPVDVTLITHERNKTPMSNLKEHPNISYIAESELTKKYFPLVVDRLTMKGKNN